MKNIKKIAVIAVNALFNNHFSLALFGVVNTYLLRGKFNTIFLMYPATKSYASKYIYPWYQKRTTWNPIMIGAFRQGKHWGLVFGISATEEDLRNDDNLKNLSALNDKVEANRKLLGMANKRYAGILPSVFISKQIIRDSMEGGATVSAVIAATDQLRRNLGLGARTPLVLLGGMGYIGKGVLAGLKEYAGEIHPIDYRNGERLGQWPAHLEGKDLIVLNVSKNGALGDYIGLFWDKVVVLNEVYPEPSDDEIKKMKERGVRCFHVVGVEGRAWPPFPAAYSGAVPCCAATISGNEGGLNTVLKEL